VRLRSSSMDAVVVGQVGYGYWGPSLARNFAGRPGGHLAVLADQDPARRVLAGESLPGTRIVADARSVIDDPEVEAVVLATPPATHAALAVAAMRAGKHVFIEKPLALTVEDGATIAAAAEDTGLVVVVGHLLLFHPAVRALTRIVDTGGLGDLWTVECERTNLGQVRSDVNAWWSIAPHDVAVILSLTGGEPDWVSSFGQAFIRPGREDDVYTALRFPTGQIAHVHASWLSPHRRRRLSVVGSKAMAVFDDAEPVDKVRLLDRGVDVTESGGEISTTLRDGGATAVPFADTEPLAAECDHFLDLIRTGERRSPAGVHEALSVLRVLEAGTRSLRDGAPVVLSPR